MAISTRSGARSRAHLQRGRQDQLRESSLRTHYPADQFPHCWQESSGSISSNLRRPSDHQCLRGIGSELTYSMASPTPPPGRSAPISLHRVPSTRHRAALGLDCVARTGDHHEFRHRCTNPAAESGQSSRRAPLGDVQSHTEG